MGFSLYDVKSFYSDQEVFTPASTLDTWTAVSPSETGPFCLYQLIAWNDDTVDHVLDVGIVYGGTGTPNTILSVTLPAGSGVGGVPSVDLLASLVPINGGLFIVVPKNEVVFRLSSAISADKLAGAEFILGRF